MTPSPIPQPGAEPVRNEAEDEIILAMCRAHDREESAQKGEPSPWDQDRFPERDPAWEQERFFAMREAFDLAAGYFSAQPVPPAVEPEAPAGRDEAWQNALADRVVRDVCELPDYTSPEDQPDLLQCTVDELHAVVVAAVEHEALSAPTRQPEASWTPFELKPNDLSAILEAHADVEDGRLVNASQLAERIYQAGLEARQPEAESGAVAIPLDIEAEAEAWADRASVRQMVDAISEVFEKWADATLLSRFRDQITAIITQAYIEGSCRSDAPAPAPAAGDVERLREAADGVVKAHGSCVCGSADGCDAPTVSGGCLGDALHREVDSLRQALAALEQRQ